MAATDALPIPRKNAAYRVIFQGLKNDGTLITSGTGMDSEVSKDQGTFADCANEATEIATNSGLYYLDLTGGEMNADCVAVKVTWTNANALPQVIVLYPEETGDIRVNITAVLSSAIASINEFKADVSGIPAAVHDYAISLAGSTSTFLGYVLSKLGLITAGAVNFTAPVEPDAGNLTLYDQDYTADSGITRPSWSSSDWVVFDLSNAVSITLSYKTKDGANGTIGTMEVVSDEEVRLAELTKAQAQLLPYGKDVAGIKIVAALSAAKGSDTVELVNAGLNHYNYRKVAE